MRTNTGITLNNVVYKTSQTVILNNLSLHIKPGTFLGIIGANGAGKSSILQLLNGIIPHLTNGNLSGEVLIDDIATTTHSVAFFAKKVGLLLQNPDFSLFNLTVKEEIEFGLKNLKIPYSDQTIQQALTVVNLAGCAEHNPATLSFGEKQKLCLACILALNTDYLVLDEPIAMLDYKTSKEIYQLLTNLNQQGKTIIVVEHDTDFLWQHAKEILILDKGKIIAYAQKEIILTQKDLLNNFGLKIPHYQIN